MPAYELWLIDEGAELSARRCPISSHCVGLRGHRPPFWWGAKPPSQAICLGVDHPDPWWTGSLMGNSAFTRTSLSGVRVIMMIMCDPMGELLCHTVMGWILVLEYSLSDVCELLWLRLVVSGIKCYRFLRTWLQWCLPRY
jgi:hypothetical protein